MKKTKLKVALITSMVLFITGCSDQSEVTDNKEIEEKVLPLPLTEENCTFRVVRQLSPEKEEIMRSACSKVTFKPSFKESEPREW